MHKITFVNLFHAFSLSEWEFLVILCYNHFMQVFTLLDKNSHQNGYIKKVFLQILQNSQENTF